MKRLVTGLMTASLLVSTGCGQFIDGSARPQSTRTDPAVFFDGEVPTYGRQISSSDRIRLAYLRALRRIDVCGLANQDSLARLGEIHSVGTLFALDECDVDVKVPGDATPRYISAALELAAARGPEVARAEGLPVLEAYPGACEYLVPVDLAGLPGAGPLFGPEQPHLRVSMIAESNCAAVTRVATMIAARLARTSLPVRDGASAYTTPLAERDPCEVLSVLNSDDIGYWNIPGSGPYRCEFGIARVTDEEAVPMELSLRPRVVDASIEGRELIRTGDAEVYLDRRTCAALVFAGSDMRRRLGNGDLVDTGDVRIRPAIDISSGETDCTGDTLVEQVAARAAALYR